MIIVDTLAIIGALNVLVLTCRVIAWLRSDRSGNSGVMVSEHDSGDRKHVAYSGQ